MNAVMAVFLVCYALCSLHACASIIDALSTRDYKDAFLFAALLIVSLYLVIKVTA